MDIDAFVMEHSGEWDRLAALSRKRRLTGEETDELIGLYQRAATHLSVVQSRSPDAALIARLSRLVAAGRAAVTGSTAPAWSDAARFFTGSFPATVFRAWRWWCSVATVCSLVAFGIMAYVVLNPSAQSRLGTPEEIRQLVDHDFASYYSEHPAQVFAAQVWLNNAMLTAAALVAGILILPVVYLLLQNILNVGIVGGVMIANGKADVFFGLIVPHGLLELMCVFVGTGIGLRIGWAWIAPGPFRTRAQAVATEARAGVTAALGLAGVLAVSGAIEAFVTPSHLPTFARIGIGVVAFAGFLTYIIFFGRRATRAGETGDLHVGEREDYAPVA
ncbi:stage II sporulation protein M [Fodinicola acaciae]|uniref:stage II sporulation protein M n=1 Tax=Fodinicola acaciae TaxID=2681555 RepID=UPI0013D465F0|nr:stage II sporulation protein M [Fodinicola acaciae]